MDLFKLVGRIVISNEEANQAIDDTTKKAEGLGGALEGAGTSADNASGKMNESSKFGATAHWMGQVLYNLTEKAVNLGTNLAKMGFGFNASIESYQYSFSALLQDEEKAKQLVADIQELAKVSPLGMEGLANNAVNLLTTGTELAEIIPTLEMLGNLALGDPAHMNSVVKAFTQIISKGGLMAQEMYQLGDAMVPIRDIMTKYGGERYADGSWYQAKMTDPTFKIPAEDMIKAFQAATAEGGQWHDYMFKIMDSYNGMVDRLGEEGKETLGEFFKPFFDMAKSEVIPGLIDSLDKFRTWITENQEPLQKLADAVGEIVSVGFEGFLNMLQWMVTNGDKTAKIFGALAAAIYLGAISAHPYATAIATIVAGLAALTAHENKVKGGEILGKYSDEELANLQAYVEAMRELKEAEKAWEGDYGIEATERLWAAQAAVDATEAAVNKTKGLMDDYYDYLKMNGVGKGEDIWIDVPAKISDDSESNMQSELDDMTFESYVDMYPEMSRLYNLPTFTAYANVIPLGSSSMAGRWLTNLPGFATGLDEVPHDNFIARLHKGEAVLNSTNAEAWRSGSMGGGTARLESMFSQMMTIMQQVAQNTSGGKQVVLDSGVLVGQLAPALDTQLGTISGRKGRRN